MEKIFLKNKKKLKFTGNKNMRKYSVDFNISILKCIKMIKFLLCI